MHKFRSHEIKKTAENLVVTFVSYVTCDVLYIPMTDAPYLVGQEPPVLPMFGHHFQMKCPLESSRPGTLYYWQRYASIDRATETGFPSDMEFSEGGRVWSAEVLTSDHNGMYECRAVNEYGEEEYANVLDFFISVSGERENKVFVKPM